MIDYINKALFNSDSVDKQLTLTFSGGDVITNADIDAESMKLVESINSGSELVFGSCEASEFEITIRNVYSSHVGQTVTVSMVLDGDTANPFTFGTYKVIEDKATADRLKREIRAYDSMYDILNTDVSAWYNSLYPTSSTTKTVKQIRDSLFTHFGITQEVVTLPNDSVVVGKTISPTSLSGKDVLMALCEINARFGHIGRDGSFEYVRLQEMTQGLYPRNDLYPDDTLYPADEVGSEDIGVQGNYISAKYEEYTVDHIDKLVIRQEDTDIGCVVGSGTNAYIIQGNFLVYGKSAVDLTTIANAIKDDIFGVWYRPCEVEVRGNPCLEVGDGIRLNTSYEIVYSYIFKRTLSGIQFLRDDFYADGLKQRNEQVNSVQTQLKQLASKTASIKADVDGIETEVSDLAQQTSTSITQLSNSVAVKVSGGHVTSLLDLNTNGMSFSGDKVVFNTNNFKLDALGNAQFSGNVTGATITGSRLTTSDNQTSENGIVIDEGSIYTTNGGISSMNIDPLSFGWSGESRHGVNHKVEMYLNLEEEAGVMPEIKVSYGATSCSLKPTGVSRAASADYATSAGSTSNATNATNASYLVGTGNSVYVSSNGNFRPTDTNGQYSCGTSGGMWSSVWAVNGTIQTSDERKKKNISELTAKHLDFILKLVPKTYQMVNGTSGRFHVGFIAQDVEKAMNECGISDLEFAGFIKEKADDDYIYALRYDEFIGLLTLAIQHQEQRLTSLEKRLSRLEMKNNE